MCSSSDSKIMIKGVEGGAKPFNLTECRTRGSVNYSALRQTSMSHCAQGKKKRAMDPLNLG